MNYFLITTRGLTASTWLSKTLNYLPNVFVSHGRDFPKRSQQEITKLLKDQEYRNSRIDYEISKQRSISIKEFLHHDMADEITNKIKCLGNVHGYNLNEAIQKIKKEENGKVTIVANIVRSPLNFIISYMNMVYQNYMIFPEKYFAEHLPRIEQNKKYLSFFKYRNLNIINTIFIEACYACLSSARDLSIENYQHLKMESLTEDSESLKKFLTELCLEFNIKSQNVKNIVHSQQKIKKINSHQSAPKVFGFNSIEKQFNIEINNLKSWPSEWRLFCLKFFSKEFINYSKYYPRDELVKFFISNRKG